MLHNTSSTSTPCHCMRVHPSCSSFASSCSSSSTACHQRACPAAPHSELVTATLERLDAVSRLVACLCAGDSNDFLRGAYDCLPKQHALLRQVTWRVLGWVVAVCVPAICPLQEACAVCINQSINVTSVAMKFMENSCQPFTEHHLFG
jgi:hypothetical protein